MNMFRTLSAVILAAIACIAMAQSKVNIGYSPAADFTPVFAAKDKGFFEKRGLDVTLTRIPLRCGNPLPTSASCNDVRDHVATHRAWLPLRRCAPLLY